jgi:predicted permease
MPALREWLRRLWGTLRPHARDREMEEELKLHLDLAGEAMQRRGAAAREAQRTARIAAGGMAQVMEELRDQRGVPWLDELARNVRHAFRLLRRSPAFTVVSLLTLSLGIGATSAIFSLFNQLLLRPLPVLESSRLVNLGAPGPKPGTTTCNQSGDCEQVFSFAMFRDLERVQTVFTGIAAHRSAGANLAFGGQTISGRALLVSGGYFPVLAIQPALGRLLGPGDDSAPGDSPVVVLSHAFWQSHFAGSPNVLNQTMVVNGAPMTIVGVAPAGFEGTTIGPKPHVFVPITLREPVNPFSRNFDNRRSYWVYLFARLKPGVSIQQARTSLNGPYHAILNDLEAGLQKGLSDQTMARFKARTILVQPGSRGQWGGEADATPPLTLLLGVTALVLLIACANIANLLLARSAARAGEISVRVAIGATRRHIVTQLLIESCTLALFGGIGGIAVAHWTLGVIGRFIPAQAADLIEVRLDPVVLIFTAVLAFGTGLLFGLFPAIYCSRIDVAPALKGQSDQQSGARGASRFRTLLATTQIALATLLLVSAGLFTKSLVNISRVELGLKAENVVGFRVSPRLNGYDSSRSRELFERMESELRALPGITSASGSLVQILASSNWGGSVSVEGFTTGPDTDTNSQYNEVGPGYFHTLGIPLVAGREFRESDALDAPKVVIVNQAFVRKFDLGAGAVGKRVGNRDEALDSEIVGVVRDAKYSEVKREIPPQYFRPYRQNKELGALNFYVRTAVNPTQTLSEIPTLVARLDPNLPVEFPTTLVQQVRENMFLDLFVSVLSAAFACLATLLAAIGLYGVLACTVAQRTREIGLRVALGATPRRVRAMILRQVAVMVLVGSTIGLVVAALLGRLAESMLYQLKGSDPGVLVAAGASLALVALGAGFIPAYRASRIDPMRALRYE